MKLKTEKKNKFPSQLKKIIRGLYLDLKINLKPLVGRVKRCKWKALSIVKDFSLKPIIFLLNNQEKNFLNLPNKSFNLKVNI